MCELSQHTRAPHTDICGWLNIKLFALLLFVLVFALFPEVFLGLGTFVYRDFGIFSYPNAYYFRESFWRGEIPLWNPLNNCGIPFLAQWNSQVLYPPALFYLIFPLELALPWFNLFHLIFGGLGMFLLLKSLKLDHLSAAFGAVVFCFNGIMINCVMWQSNVAAMTWMPWTILAILQSLKSTKKTIFAAVISGSFQMLAGSPEITICGWIIATIIVSPELVQFKKYCPLIQWRKLAKFFIIIFCISILCSIQLLPFFQLLALSQRTGEFIGSIWSLPLGGWANFFAPLYHFYPTRLGVYHQYNQYWITSYYPGIFTTVLSIYAVWRVRSRLYSILFLISLLGIILAMGNQGILYKYLFQIFPQINMMRYPVKFMLLPIMIFPFLSARALNYLLCLSQEKRKIELTRLLLLIAVSAIITVLILIDCKFYPLEKDDWHSTARNAVERILICIFSGVALFAIVKYFRKSVALSICLLALLFVDLATHNPVQNPTVEHWVYEPNMVAEEWKKDPSLLPLPQNGVSRAMVRPADNYFFGHIFMRDLTSDYIASRLFLFCNCNLLENIPKVDGFFPLTLERMESVYALLRRKDKQIPAAIADYMSVSHINQQEKFFHWERRPGYCPFVTIGQKPIFLNRDETLKKMASEGFNPLQEIYLPSEFKNLITASFSTNCTAKIINFAPHKIELEVRSDTNVIVSVSQAYYPLWKAYIDGVQSRVIPANYAFQAVEVNAGRHLITLKYIDYLFIAGLIFSGLMAIILILGRAQKLA